MSDAPPSVGETIAPFTIESTHGSLQIPHPDGLPTLLLFYVESGTPLCARQIGAFEQDGALLADAGAVAVAVSVDPPDRQRDFAGALNCERVALAADPDGVLARRFGVYDEGERRARRAAFVIGGDGTVLAAEGWYNPANSAQYAALFAALLPEAEDDDG
jgi:peroxiredoxin